MNKNNILIIDDNTKNIQVVASVLKSTNLYNIYFATTGEKGIKQLKLRKHSLILLDVNMPELNGYQTAKIIKNDSLQSQIPIIFLSANTNKESIHKGFECGGADYLTKPFDEIELLHRVKTHIELFVSKQKLQTEVDNTKVLLEQYKIAVDSSALVSKTDSHGIITYVNDKFCELSKYTREELIGQAHNISRSPDTNKEVFKDLWDTIKAKKIWKGIIKNRAKDDSSYYVESTVMPILDAHNEILEYISIRTDITKEIELREEIISSHKEILHTLGELGEWRSKETGEHVRRVSLFSEVLAKAYGCTHENTQLLKMASPMHDIGKIVIPDNILLKPEKLTDEEFAIMRNHTTYGWEIFHKSQNSLLQAAAIISYEHHERWDGKGYPRGISGKNIHIFGRITAVADVFDALVHERVYKKAWSIEETLDFMKKERGKAFEAKIVDLLLENIDEIIKIKTLYAN